MKIWRRKSAKLLENPDADFDVLLNTFLNAYYGKAAPFIRQYRLKLLESIRKKKPYIPAFMPSAFSFTHLTCDTVIACDQILEQADPSANGVVFVPTPGEKYFYVFFDSKIKKIAKGGKFALIR